MADPHVLTLTAQALMLVLLLSMPPIIAAAAVGLIISFMAFISSLHIEHTPGDARKFRRRNMLW